MYTLNEVVATLLLFSYDFCECKISIEESFPLHNKLSENLVYFLFMRQDNVILISSDVYPKLN